VPELLNNFYRERDGGVFRSHDLGNSHEPGFLPTPSESARASFASLHEKFEI
jgi:hypothetical protein